MELHPSLIPHTSFQEKRPSMDLPSACPGHRAPSAAQLCYGRLVRSSNAMLGERGGDIHVLHVIENIVITSR